jgi:hypothetical protein
MFLEYISLAYVITGVLLALITASATLRYFKAKKRHHQQD